MHVSCKGRVFTSVGVWFGSWFLCPVAGMAVVAFVWSQLCMLHFSASNDNCKRIVTMVVQCWPASHCKLVSIFLIIMPCWSRTVQPRKNLSSSIGFYFRLVVLNFSQLHQCYLCLHIYFIPKWKRRNKKKGTNQCISTLIS